MFQSLFDGLSEVDKGLWKDVVDIQKNWFGQCEGVRFHFKLHENVSYL